jgi:UDP-glucose 4-epimerase
LYVKDCISGIFASIGNLNGKINICNIGTEEYLTVDRVAQIVTEEMGLRNTSFKYTGGERGWPGDQPFVYLTNDRLKSTGWAQTVKTEDAIRKTVGWLLQNGWIFVRRK